MLPPPCTKITAYSSGICRCLRSPASAAALMLSNSGERWLISITLIPLPRQSSNSSRIRSSTGSGNAPGPALKLCTRFTARPETVLVLTTIIPFLPVVRRLQPLSPAFQNNRCCSTRFARPFTSRYLRDREFHPPPHRINSLRSHPHPVSQPPRQLFRFCSAPAPRTNAAPAIASRQRDHRVIPLAENHSGTSRILQSVYRQQAFHKNLKQLHKASEFLHRDNQRLVFLAKVLLHKLRRLPVHQFSLRPVRPPLRFRSFRRHLLQLPLRIECRFRAARLVRGLRRSCLGMLQRPLQHAMHHQIRIPSYWRGEMRVLVEPQRKMPQRLRRVSRLLQPSQHQIRNDPLRRLTCQLPQQSLVMLRRNFYFRRGRRRHAHSALAPMTVSSRPPGLRRRWHSRVP